MQRKKDSFKFMVTLHYIVIVLVIIAWAGDTQAEPLGMESSSYFSADYQKARNKFLEADKAIGARIESFECPVDSPEGVGLYTDIASFGANHPKAILVLVSGTHGVEGFAGSVFKWGFCRKVLPLC